MKWIETTLGDVAKIVGGGTPRTSIPDYWGGDINWITPKDLSKNKSKYIIKGERNITTKGLKNSSARILPPNSVLLSSRAPIGYVVINKNEVCTNQGFKSLIMKNNNSPNFYYYLLKTLKDDLENHSSGSTFKEISGSVVKQIKIRVPERLEDQEKIAQVLSSLDSKIELLQEQNKTLEELSQAIFKNTFSSPHPSWKINRLGDVLKISYGKTLPTNCFLDNGYPVFGGNGQIGWYSSFLYEFPQVLISCRGAASGKVNISAKKSFITNNSLVLDFRESALDYPFLRSWATYNNFSSFVSGSAQPQITIESLSSCEIVVPDDKTMERFNLQVEPMFDKILLNSEQIGTLEATRDSLLPKLMSGKLELKDC